MCTPPPGRLGPKANKGLPCKAVPQIILALTQLPCTAPCHHRPTKKLYSLHCWLEGGSIRPFDKLAGIHMMSFVPEEARRGAERLSSHTTTAHTFVFTLNRGFTDAIFLASLQHPRHRPARDGLSNSSLLIATVLVRPSVIFGQNYWSSRSRISRSRCGILHWTLLATSRWSSAKVSAEAAPSMVSLKVHYYSISQAI